MSDLVGALRLQDRTLSVSLVRGLAAIESRANDTGVTARLLVPKSALPDLIKLLHTAREELGADGGR